MYATGCSDLNETDLMIINWHILTIIVARDFNSRWERRILYQFKESMKIYAPKLCFTFMLREAYS